MTSGPITSWQTDGENVGNKSQISFSNLGSISKSRDITLPAKVCIVKAIVFPVIMYGCESWTIKKAECQKLMLLTCGTGEDS